MGYYSDRSDRTPINADGRGKLQKFIRVLRASPRPISLLVILGACLSACLPLAATPEALPPTETPAPSQTPTTTPTIVWFPPTDTPTAFPTLPVTPTEDYRPGAGEIILEDDFSSGEAWTLGRTAAASAALGKNELTIALSSPEAYLASLRQGTKLRDFYLEITASPTLCHGQDEYGLLLRATSEQDFIRFSLSCDGQTRVDRLAGGTASSPQPWTPSGAIPPGAPSISRLAVWAVGKEMRFFVNDFYLFSVSDPVQANGSLGVFTRSAGEMAVTVSFSDLVVREVKE